MEPLTETIDLDIDESNELAFKIKMEGASSSPAKVRLVCEGDDFSYMFNGYGTGEPEVVQFTLPRMSAKLSEGTYKARVEVLVENRYFAPVQFDINFKKTLSVVAESIVVKPKAVQPEIKVSATPVVVQKPQPVAQIKFEQRPEPKTVAKAVTESSERPVSKFSSLKEAYLKRMKGNLTEEVDDDTIREIARSLLRDKVRK